MNLKRINTKKSLKFLGLLLSSLLIATVSAATYRYLYIDGSITVGTQMMVWIVGSDGTLLGASVSGTTASVDFNVEQGTPVNFTETLFLKNQNATGSFTYNITLLTNVDSVDFQKAQMHIFENYTAGPAWNHLDTIDLTNAVDYYSNSLSAGNYLRMTFDINATIATGTENFDVQVEYWAP